MIRRICRAVIWVAAVLAPRGARARWREEWLAEIAAARLSDLRLAARVGSAPLDALLLHWTPSSTMSVRNGWTVDFRDAWRALAKTPLQTATMIGSLAVGAALMVAVFAAGNALVAGEQPGIRDRDSLAFLERRERARVASLTVGHFAAIDWNNLPAAVVSAGGEMRSDFDLVIDGLPHRVRGSLVTGRFFETLGTTPHLGRLLSAADEGPTAPAVVVIGHGLWQRAFGGRPDVVGRVIQMPASPVEIVGVAPAGFVGTEVGDLGHSPDADEELWIVLRPTALAARGKGYRSSVGPRVVVRLAPGATRPSAESALGGIVPALRAEDTHLPTLGVALLPFRFAELEEASNHLTGFFAALLFIPTVVLLIGAANVASLQAARAAWRVHELAVRTSLGATRARLARLLAIESGLVAIGATVAAWLLATAALRYGASLLPFVAAPDWRVLLFALGLPIAITLLIGILPSWRATGFDVLAGLRLGGRTGQGGRRRWRRAVVSTQIAVSVALVLASLVLARAIETGPMGVARSRSDVLVAGFYLKRLPGSDRRPAINALMTELSAFAPSRDIAFSSGEVSWSGTAYIGDPRHQKAMENWGNYVDARFAQATIFDLLDVELQQGRVFTDGQKGVMVVNEEFARRFGAGAPLLGSTHQVTPSGMLVMNAKGEWVESSAAYLSQPLQVIGVVRNGFERDRRGRPTPMVYMPFDATRVHSFSVFMRPANVAEAQRKIRELAGRVSPVSAPAPLATVAELTDAEYRGHRWVSAALGYTGSLALLLACVGLFGLISTAVAQRRHEYAVRVALGAHRRAIVRLVLGDVARLTVIGLAAGFVLAVPAWYLIRDEVASHATMFDPWAVLTVAGGLTAAAGAAAFVPALRAGAADPLSALRGD